MGDMKKAYHILVGKPESKRPFGTHRAQTSSSSSSFLGFTAQRRPWPPLQNPAEFLGCFSTIFFFTG
jgi:hypothetical protein